MSISEILTGLDSLTSEELDTVREKIDLLSPQVCWEETPEELAAIEEGRRSAREEGVIPIEEVMAEIPTWNTKSS